MPLEPLVMIGPKTGEAYRYKAGGWKAALVWRLGRPVVKGRILTSNRVKGHSDLSVRERPIN